MTLSSVRARAGLVRRDQSVAVALILLLALVFAPAIGLHVAASAFTPQPATPGVAAAAAPAKPSRG
ncbi:hypothetical protein [Methylobacterium isbiliense]|jgi:4-amino-4-deoxy-L-arabinose transferase-like glycosyltransferase|uniref:ABC transporter permease n=1 Tax=Methylobacterium isbiliense TaxID=315478 RepID=A0ABQ4SM65_9HYPH|nr:hypothetical protein [Methylobacterium isbiliense]MDN3626993.1 hypothetical protein [Methylobacterium isbiliense]GJE02885.1 hypothetical protein GMJLKIPL_4834 [Methylobacterium isbiliense]